MAQPPPTQTATPRASKAAINVRTVSGGMAYSVMRSQSQAEQLHFAGDAAAKQPSSAASSQALVRLSAECVAGNRSLPEQNLSPGVVRRRVHARSPGDLDLL